LGELEARDGKWLLDGRVENLPLENQQALVIDMAPDGSVAGFPVLRAEL